MHPLHWWSLNVPSLMARNTWGLFYVFVFWRCPGLDPQSWAEMGSHNPYRIQCWNWAGWRSPWGKGICVPFSHPQPAQWGYQKLAQIQGSPCRALRTRMRVRMWFTIPTTSSQAIEKYFPAFLQCTERGLLWRFCRFCFVWVMNLIWPDISCQTPLSVWMQFQPLH